MKKYRKLPVEIEAVELREDNIFDVISFLGQEVASDFVSLEKFEDYKRLVRQEKGMWIETLEDKDGSKHFATIGDYIIKGVKGELYPCKPDIFKATYEEVVDYDSIFKNSKCDRCGEVGFSKGDGFENGNGEWTQDYVCNNCGYKIS